MFDSTTSLSTMQYPPLQNPCISVVCEGRERVCWNLISRWTEKWKNVPWYLEIHTFHHHILDVYTLWKYTIHPNRTVCCNLRKRTNLRRTTWDSHNFRNDIVPPDIPVCHTYVSWPNVVLHRLMRVRSREREWWIWKRVWSCFQRNYSNRSKLRISIGWNTTYTIQNSVSLSSNFHKKKKKKKSRALRHRTSYLTSETRLRTKTLPVLVGVSEESNDFRRGLRLFRIDSI